MKLLQILQVRVAGGCFISGPHGNEWPVNTRWMARSNSPLLDSFNLPFVNAGGEIVLELDFKL